ncbi:PucR family transcriptional regulator [Millisia brevis]|uniref:PucR family transcriptional regulator n=1 Tax=Millisia brevis TaxID=264148 RepID=UPI000835D7DB|nr:PucR family transcriptional regulator [Millisia brevis]
MSSREQPEPGGITVAELVADPQLRLEVVAGRGAVDRRIEVAAVSELRRPGPWMQGGELLLTIGLLLPDDLPGCRAYLRDLDAHGVRAIGLGLGAELPHRHVPEALITAAEELGIPLLIVPDPVPFVAVTKAVFHGRAQQERRGLEWALRAQRDLTLAAVSPGGLPGILAAYHRATGGAAVVLDRLGRVLADAGPGASALPTRLRESLVAVRAGGITTTAADIDADRRREVHPLGARRVRGHLLVEVTSSAFGSQVTAGAVSVLTLELERMYALDAADRYERSRLLEVLGREIVSDAAATHQLTKVGVPGGDRQAAVIAAPDDADEMLIDVFFTLPDALARAVDGHVEVVVPAGTDLAGSLGHLAADRAVGIGTPTRPGALAVSLRQAWSAVSASRIRGRHVGAREIADIDRVLEALPDEVRRGYADTVLGPLDAADRSEPLLESLDAFLRGNGHWESAAAALGVHRHTLRNRLDAVARLTGRRLDSAQDRHELWLALRAREIG